MKQKNLLKTMLLLFALIVGSTSVWAQDNAGDGSQANPFSVAELVYAIEHGMADKTECYVTGIVSQIGKYYGGSDKALTYYISDDGTTTNQFQVYKGKGLNGADFTAASDLEIGTLVTVKGEVNIYNVRTLEKSQITELGQRTNVNITSFAADETTLVKGNTTNTTVANDQSGWTASYTYTSSNTDVATVSSSGVISAVAKGTARITVTPDIADDDANYRAGASMYVDITVNNPSYNVIFSVNGVESVPTMVEEGENVIFPNDVPATIGSKIFVGWTTSAIVGSQDDAPATLITTATTPMGAAATTYYAVYAESTTGLGNVTLSITPDTENIPAEYGTANKFIEYTFEGKKFKVQQMCKTTQNEVSYLQWRAAGDSNGTGTMYNTDKLNKIQSIVLTYDPDDTHKNFTVKVGASENPTSETSITPTANGSVYTFDCSAAEMDYFVLTNGNYAGYLYSIAITYIDETSIFTGYCTTVTDKKPVESYGWATYIPAYNVAFEDGDAYVVTEVNTTTGAVTVAPVESAPANTPILLKGEGTKTMAVLTDAPAAPSTNMLSVSDGTANGSKVPYVLAKNGEKAGFKQWTGDISDLNGRVVMWLDSAIATARSFFALDGEEATGINEMQAMKTVENEKFYNLAGQRIAQPTKGLYIVNGKKVAIK